MRNRILSKLAIASAVLLSAMLAYAADQNSIVIEGDSAVFDQISNTITYAGSVQAIQGDLVISGDKLVMALIEKGADNIRTTGAPARLTLQQSQDGDAQATQTILRASAETIVFAPGSKQLELTGNATLQQGDNIIRSEQILYDVSARQIRAEGKQDRVRMEFGVIDNSPATPAIEPVAP